MRDDVLAAGEHHAAERHHLHLFDDVADDDEGVLPDLAVGRDVIGADAVKLVDLGLRGTNSSISMVLVLSSAIDFNLLVGDLDILALGDLVALDDLVGGDLLAGLGVDLAVADAVARSRG